MDTPTPQPQARQRVWITTAQACRCGVLVPGKHYRRWGCTQGRGPLPWHAENIEAPITGWSRRHL
jgi:hypothetical protein